MTNDPNPEMVRLRSDALRKAGLISPAQAKSASSFELVPIRRGRPRKQRTAPEPGRRVIIGLAALERLLEVTTQANWAQGTKAQQEARAAIEAAYTPEAKRGKRAVLTATPRAYVLLSRALRPAVKEAQRPFEKRRLERAAEVLAS